MDKKAKENILTNLKMPSAFYPVIIMIIFLIIMMSLIFFKVPINFTSKPLSKSQNEIIANVFVILFFTLIVVILSFMLLPNFKDFKELFQQISSVTYVLLYTIFLILFLTLMPDETLDSYAIYITPITIVLGLFCFYKAAKTNYIEKFNNIAILNFYLKNIILKTFFNISKKQNNISFKILKLIPINKKQRRYTIPKYFCDKY